MSDLKNCPFCGSGAIEVCGWEEYTLIGCLDCDYAIKCRDCDEDDAVDYWNTRPAEDAKDREIDNLKRALQQIVEIANRRGHLTVAILQKDAWYGLAKIANEALANAPDMNDGKMEENK